MKIIVDACGGDHAPLEIVRGSLEAVRELGVGVVLVGRGEDILQALKESGCEALPREIEIVHADQIVEMEDNPATTLKDKPGSSMAVGLGLCAEGRGDAFVSAGNTGALLSAGTFAVKRIKGIRRAALASPLPSKSGQTLLVDSGASLDCTPEYLLQFAYMGAYYMQHARGIERPRVGLLNVGTEEVKGLPLQKEVHQLLRVAAEENRLNFVGNIEARSVPLGAADVVVCDGFSGNILLKAMEGTGQFMADTMKGMFTKNAGTKLASLLVRGGIRDFRKMMDYAEIGGAPLLGLAKPVIKAHGSSKAKAIKNAIRQAAEFSQKGVIGAVTGNIEWMKVSEQSV